MWNAICGGNEKELTLSNPFTTALRTARTVLGINYLDLVWDDFFAVVKMVLSPSIPPATASRSAPAFFWHELFWDFSVEMFVFGSQKE